MSFELISNQLSFDDHILVFNIRFHFYDYINNIEWIKFDRNSPYLSELINGLFNEAKIRAEFDEKFIPLRDQMIGRFISQPLLLFDAIKLCMVTEMEKFNIQITNNNNNGNESIPGIIPGSIPDIIPEESMQTNEFTSEQSLIEIKDGLNYCEIKLKEIQEFIQITSGLNLNTQQIEYYMKISAEFIDKQNVNIFNINSINEEIIKKSNDFQTAQKDAIIDDIVVDYNIIKSLENLFTNILPAIKITENFLNSFKKCIRNDINTKLIEITDDLLSKINIIFTLLIIHKLIIIVDQPVCGKQALNIVTNSNFEANIQILLPVDYFNAENNANYECQVRVIDSECIQLIKEQGIEALERKSLLCEITNSKKRIRIDSNGNKLLIRFTELKMKKRPNSASIVSVSEQKFVLIFIMKVKLFGKVLTIYNTSLPITIVARREPTSIATNLWDIAFAQHQNPLSAAPNEVKWSDLSRLINRRFTSKSGNYLTEDHLKVIYSKIPGLQNTLYSGEQKITWSQFAREKYLDTENRNTVWDWLHSIMILFDDDTLKSMWQNGHIIGFISTPDSVRILSDKPNQTFIIRFSEGQRGSITITYKDFKGDVIKIQPWRKEDLEFVCLAQRILNFNEITLLYPNLSKDVFENYATEHVSLKETSINDSNSYTKIFMSFFLKKRNRIQALSKDLSQGIKTM